MSQIHSAIAWGWSLGDFLLLRTVFMPSPGWATLPLRVKSGMLLNRTALTLDPGRKRNEK